MSREAEAIRNLSDADRDRLIAEAGNKVLDARERFAFRAKQVALRDAYRKPKKPKKPEGKA